MAVMLVGGGEHVSNLDILRTGAGVFGNVTSNATISRFFERTVTNPDVFSYGFSTLTRELRSRAWEAGGDRNPALKATALDPLIVDLDATLVTSHSDKDHAVGTYKGGYGFAPFIASVDYGAGNGTGEILAAVMRPGNAGANSAEDHIKVFTRAIEQLPDAFYDQQGQLIGEKVLVRTDSAGASRKFLHHLASLRVQFTVSYPVPALKAHMIGWNNDKKYWQRALNQNGKERTDAWVINATEILGLTDYPADTNLHLRAEPPTPGRSRPCWTRTGIASPRSERTPRAGTDPPWMPGTGPGDGARTDQNPEEHQAREAAVLRFPRQPGLGHHRRPGPEPGLLAATHPTAKRAQAPRCLHAAGR
ncbi:hypothetical protein ACFDR8_003061 [Arthrobacter sp. MP_2.3]